MAPPLIREFPINSNAGEKATFHLRRRKAHFRIEGVSYLHDAGGLFLTVGAEELGKFRVARPRFVDRDTLQNG